MKELDWTEKFIHELSRELDARCNMGSVVFKHNQTNSPEVPEYSVTTRGKTIWLQFKWWTEHFKPTFCPLQSATIEKLMSAFYVHIFLKQGQFQGVSITVSETPDEIEDLGNAVRYLCSFFDLDTTDLEY